MIIYYMIDGTGTKEAGGRFIIERQAFIVTVFGCCGEREIHRSSFFDSTAAVMGKNMSRCPSDR